MRKILAAMAAIVLTLTMSSQVFAWGYDAGGARWQPNNVTWCFSPSYTFPYQSMRDTITQGIAQLNGKSKLVLTQVTCSTEYNAMVVVRYESLGTGAPVAVDLQPSVYNGYITTPSQIIFNRDNGSKVYWYQATQSCTAGWSVNGYPVCKGDAWSIAAHEMGHAVGLGHNISPDFTYTCWGGYYSTDIFNACYDAAHPSLTGYKEDPMYWSAADGYRRPITGDMIGGLKALYGAP